jgi:hypothetical protein
VNAYSSVRQGSRLIIVEPRIPEAEFIRLDQKVASALNIRCRRWSNCDVLEKCGDYVYPSSNYQIG